LAIFQKFFRSRRRRIKGINKERNRKKPVKGNDIPISSRPKSTIRKGRQQGSTKTKKEENKDEREIKQINREIKSIERIKILNSQPTFLLFKRRRFVIIRSDPKKTLVIKKIMFSSPAPLV
jgi:hypothetical protein